MAKYEEKYLVIKNDDIENYLSVVEELQFDGLVRRIAKGRDLDGKTPNAYYVVNQNEPYSSKVINLIIKEETALE